MSDSVMQGSLRKMHVQLDAPVDYQLPLSDGLFKLNTYLGQRIRLAYQQQIHCVHCGRKTNKSFSQGYCYPCMKKLAQCDICIVSPEKCHYHQGTCREPEWGEQHCMQPHFVYLANSSGLKVGITRSENIPTRWIDQGAIQAIPVLAVQTRYQSGMAEVLFKQHIADKTNWRVMLRGKVDKLDLYSARTKLLRLLADQISDMQNQFGIQSVQSCEQAETIDIEYPVIEYPDKIVSLNFDKTPEIEGTLLGIKGQYLILDIGVLNVRKFAGYQVEFSV